MTDLEQHLERALSYTLMAARDNRPGPLLARIEHHLREGLEQVRAAGSLETGQPRAGQGVERPPEKLVVYTRD